MEVRIDIRFPGILTMICIGLALLKIFKVIHVSWFIVFSPLIAWFIFATVFIVIAFIIYRIKQK